MSTIDIPLWTTILGNFGFPIVITIYLFLRFERKLEKLEEVILKCIWQLRNVANGSIFF